MHHLRGLNESLLYLHALIVGVKRLDVEVEHTDLALAFELNSEQLSQQQVFAFLPLRRYGLRFIVQVTTPICVVKACNNLPKHLLQHVRFM